MISDRITRLFHLKSGAPPLRTPSAIWLNKKRNLPGSIMMNSHLRLIPTWVVCGLGMAGQARAQNTITLEKRAIINDLLKVTRAEQNIQASIAAVHSVMGKSLTEVISKTIPDDLGDKGDLSEEAKKRAAELTSKTMDRFHDRLMKEISVSDLIEKVMVPLYDKFYTESELKDLIAFYETPTGQKAVVVQPQLTGEAMQKTMNYLMPKIQTITTEMSKEVEDEIKKSQDRHNPRQ